MWDLGLATSRVRPGQAPFVTDAIGRHWLSRVKRLAWAGGDSAAWASVGIDLDDFISEVEVAGAEARKTETEAAREKVRSWAEAACAGGASAAHRCIKGSRPWATQEVVGPDGRASTCEDHIIGRQRDTWTKLWDATDSLDRAAARIAPKDRHRRSRVTIDELRTASRGFKGNTAVVDGWHPRHFALLSDGALGVLAAVLELPQIQPIVTR